MSALMQKKQVILLALFITGLTGSFVFAQAPPGRAAKIEMKRADLERADREAANRPTFPPAKMNVDVQAVLTTLERKDFAEARLSAVSRVKDGDPLWLYVKFNGTLNRYVYRSSSPNGDERYVLFVEIGPQGEVTAKNHYVINFQKKDLKLAELKISLSPGAAGHIRAIPIFLRNTANLKTGIWNNEIRLTNNPSLPRGLNDYLAKTGVVLDLSVGPAKYPAMMPVYESMVLRGTADTTKLPLPGKFADAALRDEILSELGKSSIRPASFYFAGDGWSEYSDSPMSVRQFRNIFAVYIFVQGKDCFYGIARVVQKYDPGEDDYGNSNINLQKDVAIPCTQIN